MDDEDEAFAKLTMQHMATEQVKEEPSSQEQDPEMSESQKIESDLEAHCFSLKYER